MCRPAQPDDDRGIFAMARIAARHRDARRERFSRDAGEGTREWFARQARATRALPVVVVGHPTWPFMHLERLPSHLAARTSRYVSLDTYLQLLVPFSPAHQTARQDKTDLPVKQRSRRGNRNVNVFTSRRSVYVPGVANDAQGSPRPCTSGEGKANVGCRILPTAVRLPGAVGDSPPKNREYSPVVPTTRAGEPRPGAVPARRLQRTDSSRNPAWCEATGSALTPN